MESRNAELDVVIEKIIEQNATGILTDSRFALLLNRYEEEQSALRQQLIPAKKELDKKRAAGTNIDAFLNLLNAY
jgi:hypothetical protein